MKKTLTLLAAMAIGTVAVAQDAPPSGTMPAPTAPAPGDASTAPAGPESSAPPAPADATPPAPTDATSPAPNVSPSTGIPAPTTADMSSYPRCSAGVTDHCVQHEGKMMRRRPR